VSTAFDYASAINDVYDFTLLTDLMLESRVDYSIYPDTDIAWSLESFIRLMVSFSVCPLRYQEFFRADHPWDTRPLLMNKI